jgi:ribosomal-protein-alanine N-acetyltransferase
MTDPQSGFQAMQVSDLAEVLAIEQAAYPVPWSKGNFIDSLAAGYPALVLRDQQGLMLGYLLALKGPDEMHLLNLALLPEQQGRGLARLMLDELCRLSRQHCCDSLWLEVRQSNLRARRFYQRYGFEEVGMRPAYYPVLQGQREDAVLMNLTLAGDPA